MHNWKVQQSLRDGKHIIFIIKKAHERWRVIIECSRNILNAYCTCLPSHKQASKPSTNIGDVGITPIAISTFSHAMSCQAMPRQCHGQPRLCNDNVMGSQAMPWHSLSSPWHNRGKDVILMYDMLWDYNSNHLSLFLFFFL